MLRIVFKIKMFILTIPTMQKILIIYQKCVRDKADYTENNLGEK